MNLDKYDYVLLDVIQTQKKENRNELIKLGSIERMFWFRLEGDDSQHIAETQVGERIANLYLGGYIHTRNGYALTKRGKEELNVIMSDSAG